MRSSRSQSRLCKSRFSAAFASTLCIAGVALAQADVAGPDKKAGEARVLWKYAPAGSRFSEVVTSGDAVFALDRAGAIHALDAASGEELWKSEGEIPLDYGFGLALSVDPEFDAIFVGCDAGFLALDRATGEKLWETEIKNGVAGPACTKAAVMAGSSDGKVYACEPTTGEILWQHDYLQDRPDDPPGFDGNQARFGGRPARPQDATTDGQMVVLSIFDQCRALALDVATGKRLWDFRTQGWMYGRPAIGPRNVYVGSQDKHLYAVDKVMGKLAWEVKTGSRVEGGAAPTERFAYFGSCDGNLYSVDHGVGRVTWKFATEHEKGRGAPLYGTPLVLGDTVYLAAMRGTIYAVERESGNLLWKIDPLERSELNSDLVFSGGRLFVTTRKDGDDGESAVLAIELP